MKKMKLIAALLPALASAGAMAGEVFNDGTNKVTIGGRAEAIGQAGDNADGSYRRASLSTGSTRINFGFERQISEGLKAEALFEWQVNMLANNDGRSQPLTNRLGYLGLSDTTFGQFRIGKQWAAVYDVFGATDVIYISDHDAGGIYQFGDGGTAGTGRLDHSATFANQIGAWTLGAQYGVAHQTQIQGQDAERGHNFGASVSYRFSSSLKLGVAYNQSEIDRGFNGMNNGDTISATAASVTYQNYGYHVAATLVNGRNYHTTGFQSGTSAAAGRQGNALGGDVYFAYTFPMGLEPYLYGSVVSFDGKGANTIKGERQMAAFGMVYHIDGQTQVGAEFRRVNTILEENDSNFGVKVRYFF